MSVVQSVQRVSGAISRRVSPLREHMTARDYWQVRRTLPLQSGVSKVDGKAVAFSDPIGFLHSVNEIFNQKVYDFRTDKPDPHIIDAGANIGLSVIYFKQLFPRSTIIAYEPDSEIFSILKENVGSMEGVELREAAAWIDNTELTFFKEGSLAGSVEVDFSSKGEAVTVKAERLRDQIRRRPVDFLKIDIEGAENAVLFDIADELDGVDRLFFEYHSTPEKPQLLGQLLGLVADRGFRYAINGTHGPTLPFVDRLQSGFDLQLNVFCFR